ncbi:MAG: DUF2341 domain-containing protein [Planctomycetota bacterium]
MKHVLLLLVAVGLLAVFATGVSAQAFQNFRTITATNAGASVQTNYQVLVELDTGNFNYANVQGANGEDIRFFETAGNGGGALNYFIETWNNTGTSLIWVMLPSIPASGTVDFEMHYNDAGTTTSGANFAATFPNAYVSSGNATLTGTQTFDWFEVQSGDTITVGAGSPFVVNARRVVVDGTIDGVGAGNQAPGTSNNGTGPGGGFFGTSSGASGGGYGGAGGDGGYDSGDPIQAGGAAYGSPTSVAIQMGSSGGSAPTVTAGSGGGAVDLRGFLVTVTGAINCSGALAQQPGGGQGAGGGSGGGILIGGYDVTVSGTLTADGNGGSIGTSTANDDGGGGGGGRIKVFYENTGVDTSTTSVAGGAGGVNGSAGTGDPGSAGTTNSAQDSTVIEEVTNAVGTEQNFGPSAPNITTTAPATATVGIAYTYTVAASGSPAPAFTIAGTLPTGLTWDGTNTISGTPTATGVFAGIVITATNTQGTDTENITITVSNNAAPTITVTENSNAVAADQVITIALNDTVASMALSFVAQDADSADTVTVSTSVSPSGNITGFTQSEWDQATAANPTTAATPTTGTVDVAGLITVIVTATDNNSAATTFRFFILVPVTGNTAPTVNLATGSAFTGNATSGFSYAGTVGTPLANATLDLFDTDADAIDVITESGTAAGITLPGTGTAIASGTTTTWIGTPTTAGTFVITYVLTDNNTAPVTVTVTFNISGGGSSGGGGGGGGGGCSTGGTSQYSWMVLLGLLSAFVVFTRVRGSKA